MPSKTRSVRETQKSTCEAAIAARQAALRAKGVTQAAIAKDPTLKALLAKFRQIQRTLSAIRAKEEKNEELAQRKQEKAAQPKLSKAEKKAKGGKKAEQQTQQSGKKAKKEKKKG